MPQLLPRVERYSASSSSLRHSPALKPAISGDASCGPLQGGRPAHGGGELTSVLWSGFWRVAGGKAVQHLAKTLFGQILVGILPDQDHRCIDAGAEALDLFPAETAVLGEVKGIMMDPALANLDDIAGAAQPTRRSAADLDMRLLADRLQLEHRIERRDLQHADVGHLEQVRDRADRGFRDPPLMLFLHPPQNRDRRRSLAARRIFCNLLLRPGEILRREREVRGLQFLRCEAADGHFGSVSHCMRCAALAFKALIRFCQKGLAVPNTL